MCTNVQFKSDKCRLREKEFLTALPADTLNWEVDGTLTPRLLKINFDYLHFSLSPDDK